MQSVTAPVHLSNRRTAPGPSPTISQWLANTQATKADNSPATALGSPRAYPRALAMAMKRRPAGVILARRPISLVIHPRQSSLD